MTYESIYDQGVGTVNEDALLVDPDNSIFGVFDGATGLDKYINNEGKTGGYLASHIAKETFVRYPSLPLKEVFVQANKNIQESMTISQIDMTDKINLWNTALAVIRIQKSHTLEWIQTGDCIILLIYKDKTHKVLVTDYDHDHETNLMWHQLAKQKISSIRSELIDQIKKVRREANIRYGILNGEPESLEFLKTAITPLDNVSHVLLFTDGLIIPKEDPSDPDNFNLLVSIFLEQGLEAVKNYVRKIENGDPESWKYPRFKKHDDIGAIAITL